MAMAERGGARLLLRRRRRPRRSENGARGDSGGRWRDEGAPRRGVAYTDRVLATRGRRRGHAAAMFCAGRPLYIRDSVDSDEQRDV